MFKKILFVSLLTLAVFLYAFAVNRDLSENLVRLHVIANSNERCDQELKFMVRDAVLSETRSITEGITDKQEAVKAVIKNKDAILKSAKNVIAENGYDYSVGMEYGNFFFPEKKYDNIELPSGRYDAIRIKIGKAEGENWWCVMFPPLCISEDAVQRVDDESIKYLKQNLSKEEMALISSDKKTPVIIRFRIVDAVMKLTEYIKRG